MRSLMRGSCAVSLCVVVVFGVHWYHTVCQGVLPPADGRVIINIESTIHQVSKLTHMLLFNSPSNTFPLNRQSTINNLVVIRLVGICKSIQCIKCIFMHFMYLINDLL